MTDAELIAVVFFGIVGAAMVLFVPIAFLVSWLTDRDLRKRGDS